MKFYVVGTSTDRKNICERSWLFCVNSLGVFNFSRKFSRWFQIAFISYLAYSLISSRSGGVVYGVSHNAVNMYIRIWRVLASDIFRRVWVRVREKGRLREKEWWKKRGLTMTSVEPGCRCADAAELVEDNIEQLHVVSPLVFHRVCLIYFP